jgi:hypothetical protein
MVEIVSSTAKPLSEVAAAVVGMPPVIQLTTLAELVVLAEVALLGMVTAPQDQGHLVKVIMVVRGMTLHHIRTAAAVVRVLLVTLVGQYQAKVVMVAMAFSIR